MSNQLKIQTLPSDIGKVLIDGKEFTVEQSTDFGTLVGKKLKRQLARSTPERKDGVIRASELGVMDTCARKFWYNTHPSADGSAMAEPLPPNVILKFFYGDVIEETILTLARLAGHDVSNEQEQVVLKNSGITVVGHIDAVIDGVVVDVKSTTSRGYVDFEKGHGGNKFGYRAQLNTYAEGMGIKEKGFLAVDKQMGYIGYFPETRPYDVYETIRKAAECLELPNPDSLLRLSPTVESNGNETLCVECTYCQHKAHCWDSARKFQYANGVKYLTKVKSLPRVPEIT